MYLRYLIEIFDTTEKSGRVRKKAGRKFFVYQRVRVFEPPDSLHKTLTILIVTVELDILKVLGYLACLIRHPECLQLGILRS